MDTDVADGKAFERAKAMACERGTWREKVASYGFDCGALYSWWMVPLLVLELPLMVVGAVLLAAALVVAFCVFGLNGFLGGRLTARYQRLMDRAYGRKER